MKIKGREENLDEPRVGKGGGYLDGPCPWDLSQAKNMNTGPCPIVRGSPDEE